MLMDRFENNPDFLNIFPTTSVYLNAGAHAAFKFPILWKNSRHHWCCSIASFRSPFFCTPLFAKAKQKQKQSKSKSKSKTTQNNAKANQKQSKSKVKKSATRLSVYFIFLSFHSNASYMLCICFLLICCCVAVAFCRVFFHSRKNFTHIITKSAWFQPLSLNQSNGMLVCVLRQLLCSVLQRHGVWKDAYHTCVRTEHCFTSFCDAL